MELNVEGMIALYQTKPPVQRDEMGPTRFELVPGSPKERSISTLHFHRGDRRTEHIYHAIQTTLWTQVAYEKL